MSQASRSNQSAAGQTGTTRLDGLAVVEPDLDAEAAGSSPTRSSWYETENRFGFGSGTCASPCEPGLVEVAARRRADVPGDALLAPAEVVRGGDVAQEVEPLLVAEVRARLDEACRVDDEGRLAECLARLDDARDAS